MRTDIHACSGIRTYRDRLPSSSLTRDAVVSLVCFRPVSRWSYANHKFISHKTIWFHRCFVSRQSCASCCMNWSMWYFQDLSPQGVTSANNRNVSSVASFWFLYLNLIISDNNSVFVYCSAVNILCHLWGLSVLLLTLFMKFIISVSRKLVWTT
jgi:hypothetical protein